MSNLINKQEVLLHLQRTLDATNDDDPYGEGFCDGLSFAQNVVDGMPTVFRCKDCKLIPSTGDRKRTTFAPLGERKEE